ncbi:MAG TPA: efflux RND transporter periplasmic adaptor subunit [Thermoanaerobaculia bacterium]|nr:efflux RND transporter periplasmic adaptor subunit [Thermoanaerobaculia bacterium]
MSLDRPAPADLSALRIHRDREPRKPVGMLIFFAILAVAIGAGIYVVASGVFTVRTVETVSAAVVTEGQAETILSATGYVEADTKADLSPKITSKVTALYVTEGDTVKKGQVLARLDRTDLDAQLADAKASWVNAQAELKRQKALLSEGLTPQSAVDSAIAAEASARAKVHYVEAQQDYAEIRAPFAGRVIAKRAHVGEAVSPYGAPGQGSSNGGAIVTLVDFSTLYVGADVNESNLGRLQPNQPAEIVLDAYPDHTYHGHLLQVIPTADRSKGTVKVKVAFEDPDAKILPEMSARVNFTAKKTTGTAAAKTRVTIPKSALANVDGRSGVYLVAGGRALFREIEPGAENSGQLEVRSGLQGGERLVAEPAKSGVRNGEKVKVKGD